MVGNDSGKCNTQTGKTRLAKGGKVPQKPQTPGLFLGEEVKRINDRKTVDRKKVLRNSRTTIQGDSEMKKETTIKVLMVEPGEHPKEVTLDNNLDALQKAVSIGCEDQGLIEIIGLEDGICLLCNEEGKLLQLEGNRRVGDDIITGVFYILGEDGDGELTSLPQEAMDRYKERFGEPKRYTQSEIDKAMVMRFFYG